MTEPSSEYELVSMYVYAEHTTNHHTFHLFDPEYNYFEDPVALLCTKSMNPLINSIIVGKYPTTVENLKTVAELVMYVQQRGVSTKAEMREQYRTLEDKVRETLGHYNRLSAEIRIFGEMVNLFSGQKKEDLQKRLENTIAEREQTGELLVSQTEESYCLLDEYYEISGIIGDDEGDKDFNPVHLFRRTECSPDPSVPMPLKKPPELHVERPYLREINWYPYGLPNGLTREVK